MQRLPWIERTFHWDIPIGWLENISIRLEGTPIRIQWMSNQVFDQECSISLDGKWSIKQQIGHLWDVEKLHIARMQNFIDNDSFMHPADMLNKATESADHNSKTCFELITGFRNERNHFIALLNQCNEEVHQRTLMHPRLKVLMKPVDMATFVAEHDDHHLVSIRNQVDRILQLR